MINPYLPCNEFIADGEPYLFDGRVYIFGSHDLYGGKALCEGDYVCWSAPESDLGDWRYEGVIYKRMQDPYIRKIVDTGKGSMFNQYLYAPDVVEIEGKYYLYYGVALSGSGIGVAEAEKPTGPYTYLGRVRYPEEAKPENWTDTEDEIEDGDMALGDGIPMLQLNPFKKHFGFHTRNYPYDPAVLYDEGRLFLYYGSGCCQVAELSMKDKCTLLKNPSTGRYESDRLLPANLVRKDKAKIAAQDGWYMANGTSIRKLEDTYYLSYYARNKNNCHAMCYSTSKSPWGPFKYCGVLVSLGNGKFKNQKYPAAYGGNTHGGMVQLQGRWYQNYHRQTGDACSARQACLAELVRKQDGTFEQAEFQSQVENGAGLSFAREYPAYAACVLTNRKGTTGKRAGSPFFQLKECERGIVDNKTGKKMLQVVTGLKDGCIVGYKYIEFNVIEKQRMKVYITLQNMAVGSVDIFAGRTEQKNKLISVQIDRALQNTKTYVGKFQAKAGKQAVYFRFYGQKKETGFISFRFERDEK